MVIDNRSKAWGKAKINVTKLSGLIIAYGGLKYGRRTLVDDYLQDFRNLQIPALLTKAGTPIEDLYDDFVASGWIWPIDRNEYRDVADYLLEGLLMERRGKSILDESRFQKSDPKGFAAYLHNFVGGK